MIPDLPAAWLPAIGDQVARPYFRDLSRFVAAERAAHDVFPPAAETFNALELTPPEHVRVVILGQDPYPGPGQAHGLSFSVRPGVPLPRSLRNIYRELEDDLGGPPPQNGDLTGWAQQGVLLLNAALTVRGHAAGSHAASGWHRFTDRLLATVAEQAAPVVFVLWGNAARAKRPLLGDATVIESAHPSPLAAHRGFFGSRPFSRCNAALAAAGLDPIHWGA
jgi:uracil-DNA glycosylase